MRDSELAILFNALGEILDNQNEIMKHLGIKKYDPNNYGYYDNKTEKYSSECFSIASELESKC